MPMLPQVCAHGSFLIEELHELLPVVLLEEYEQAGGLSSMAQPFVLQVTTVFSCFILVSLSENDVLNATMRVVIVQRPWTFCIQKLATVWVLNMRSLLREFTTTLFSLHFFPPQHHITKVPLRTAHRSEPS